MKRILVNGLLIVSLVSLIVVSCRKKDVPLPDNTVQFDATEQGISAAEAGKTVTIKLLRAVSSDVLLSLSITPAGGLQYGTDYTTTPAAVAGNIALTVPSGNSEANFTVTKTTGALYDGDESLLFKIVSSASPVIIGDGKEFTLKFAEIVSTGSSIVGDGGGASYGNKVFFDLSANSQTPVARTKWDLGFYSGDDWRVILNSSTGMMAKQLAKNDLANVTADDTLAFSTDVIFNQSEPTVESLAYIDYPSGDLSKTAIQAVSITATDNKVYIINRGTGIGSPAPARGWKKVRIIRNASGGYTLQHADIASATFTSVDIPKDASFFFKYISFENGAVDVEPQAKKWDFAWAYFSNVTDFGGGEVPYTFQDMIIQNRNVQIAKVMTSTKAYADFAEADVAALTFVTAQNGIGADWRAGGGPSSAPAVHTDRYYIIKDGDNNYYKVRFTAMTQAGERGFPAFDYALVKHG